MDTAGARIQALQATFRDGLGTRRLRDGADGPLEVLTLQQHLSSTQSFEFLLRERVARLAQFRQPCFARVHDVERSEGEPLKLAIVSDHVPGVRLSRMLAIAEQNLLPLDVDSALCLVRKLVTAVALLHEGAPDACHGALAPERIIVTQDARLVVVEHVLGAALEQLQYSPERYWTDLRIALEVPAASEPRFTRRTDVVQLGAITLALLLGRPLGADEYPGGFSDLATGTFGLGGAFEPLPQWLKEWLFRALWFDPAYAFTSAVEARHALDAGLVGSGYTASQSSLEAFLTQYRASVDGPLMAAPLASSRAAAQRPAPAPSVVPASVVSAPRASASAVSSPIVSSPIVSSPIVSSPVVSSQVVSSPVASAPVVSTPVASAPAVSVPAVSVPPVSAPAVSARVVSASEVPAHVVPAPAVSAPVVSASAVPAPAAPVPAVSASVVSAPTVALPAVSAPTVSAPAVSAPAVSAPAVSAPAVSAPAVSAPAVSARTIPMPAAAPREEAASEKETASEVVVPFAATPPPAVQPTEPVIAPLPRMLGETAATHAFPSRNVVLPMQSRDEEPDDETEEVDVRHTSTSYTAGLSMSHRPRLIAAALVLMALTSGGVMAARRYLSTDPGAAATATGTLAVQSNPAGAAVVIDGVQRGLTPLSVSVSAGAHTLELSADGAHRTIPVTVTANAALSQFIEMPKAAPAEGQLDVRTDPPGAKVAVDGQLRGTSPLTVTGLAPGSHSVTLENELGSVNESVTVAPGTTASLVVPLRAPQGALVSGYMSINAPAELQVFENQRLLGSSRTDRIMVTAGRHDVELVNEALGYRSAQTIQVAPGQVAKVKPEWPQGTIAINAAPWANVWLDGQELGETPVGNTQVPIGTHEVIFRHPQLGEQRFTTTVTASTPTRLSVDMRKK